MNAMTSTLVFFVRNKLVRYVDMDASYDMCSSRVTTFWNWSKRELVSDDLLWLFEQRWIAMYTIR